MIAVTADGSCSAEFCDQQLMLLLLCSAARLVPILHSALSVLLHTLPPSPCR